MAEKPESNPSYLVDRRSEHEATPYGVRKTTAKHGLSGDECKRWSGALHWMDKRCRRGQRLGYAVVKLSERGTIHDAIGRFRSTVTKLQGELGLPKYNALLIETLGGIHGNIVYVTTDEMDDRLKVRCFHANVDIQPVTKLQGLARGYLLKERTPQANYKRQHFFVGGRIKGSHKLEGGGSRVRLSNDLARDAIEANYIEAFGRENSKRKADRKRTRLRVTGPQARAPKLSGQIPLLPELDRPVSRLRDYGGGSMPKAVAKECEHHRTRFGLSQDQLARLIGVSQPTYANVIGSRFGLSSFAAKRLREVLLMRSAG